MSSPVRPLADLATSRPDSPALIAADGRWTFRELDRAVTAVAARLRESGIRSRQTVATDLPLAEDWITTLALLRLGTRTVSMVSIDRGPDLMLDALLTRPGRPRFAAAQVIPVDRLWIEQAQNDLDPERTGSTVLYPRTDDICRVILTSGTTGTPRAALLSVGAVEHRLDHLHQYWTDDRRELNLMSASTTGGFHTGLAALRHGTPYLAIDVAHPRVVAVAVDAAIEVLCGSPVQVGGFVQRVRESGSTLPSLREVRTAGAAASEGLLREIAEVLAVPVRGVYGSTEGGGVTTRLLHGGGDPADVGRPVPGIRLEVVGENGEPCAAGDIGEVRYRGPGLASGYHGDDRQDERTGSFRGGWFYPGDHGALRADGSLVLEGRVAEIMNVGGVKIDPAAVDAIVDGFPGVADAATFLIEQRPGMPELGLAVVAQGDCDLRALDQLLRRRLPGKHPTVFGQVSVIPRNRMGKVERARLSAEFRRHLNLD